MGFVSLELFKKHVRADDFADDDKYLQHVIDTACVAVINETQRTEKELIEMTGGEGMPLPLVHAAMVLGAHWYNQRESASSGAMTEVPDMLQVLIKPYTKIS